MLSIRPAAKRKWNKPLTPHKAVLLKQSLRRSGGSINPEVPVFDKSETLFPVRQDHVYLAHCAIGPMYGPAAKAACDFIEAQSQRGVSLHAQYGRALTTFGEKAADLLGVDVDDVAYVSNTAEGVGLIANGYPFEPGDQVISYVHEFPSNHYPWTLQAERGVELVLLSDVDPTGDLPSGAPRAWSMEELEAHTTDRTRVIALSHVQFASGYAADLKRLGHFCEERGIDLVIDAAQSLGVLPVHPREHGISAVVSSAWKWLLASRGAGLVYLAPELRRKLKTTMAGDAAMNHRLDYLNHAWDPRDDARRFEYSTLPWEHLASIETVLDEVFLRYGIEAIAAEVWRLQDLLLDKLVTNRIRPVAFTSPHRSGILSLRTEADPSHLVNQLQAEGVIATTQGGYLRLAPHFYQTDDEIERVADALNRLA